MVTRQQFWHRPSPERLGPNATANVGELHAWIFVKLRIDREPDMNVEMLAMNDGGAQAYNLGQFTYKKRCISSAAPKFRA